MKNLCGKVSREINALYTPEVKSNRIIDAINSLMTEKKTNVIISNIVPIFRTDFKHGDGKKRIENKKDQGERLIQKSHLV